MNRNKWRTGQYLLNFNKETNHQNKIETLAHNVNLILVMESSQKY